MSTLRRLRSAVPSDHVVGWAALIIFILALLWALTAPCYDCGGPCGGDIDCMSGCNCYFPENDDNEHYGRCA